MNIALTGITGMVGSHLLKRLYPQDAAQGDKHRIRALIRESSVVDHLKPYEDVDYIIGDLNDKESLRKLTEGADVVVHLAHYPGPVQTAEDLVRVNVNGTFDLLEEAKKARVKQFIFMSACAVFGEVLPSVRETSPLDENHPVRPGTLYGAIKSAIESFCFFHQKSRAFDVAVLRPVTIYGVRPQIDQSEWFQTIDYLATNYNVDVKGSAKYVSADAVVQAVELCLGNKETAGRIYHLVDGHIHNLDLAKIIVDVVDSFGEVEGVKGEEGTPMSNEAARKLGVEFKGLDGIKEYIKLVHQLQVQYGGERHIQKW
ncbi:MAG: NAD(P)-dependent oxidoreductase [Nitrospinae bacterium]|nr:NAD(P)-dependent oxidoreductase [Nitrospinota bacterium]